MRHRSLLVLLPLFLLTGCAQKTEPSRTSVEWGTLMRNPLFAERYWDELTDRMVSISLQEKDLLKDPRMQATVDDVRRSALTQAQAATKMKHEGKLGSFTTVKEQSEGWTLLRGQTLSFSPDFVTYPGPSLRIFLTTVLDPREGTFPDPTSVDVGRLESPYGAQEYRLPPKALDAKMRTVALFDTKLNRLFAFAQLQ